MTAPTPVVVISSLARSSCRAIVRTRFSKLLNSRNSTSRTANSASAMTCKFECSLTSCLIRSAKLVGVVFPTFRPNPRSTPRRLISTSRSFASIRVRVVNIARVSCAEIDLQCTGRNQPIRISSAMPRASLRSVFTGIVLNALRTCRVSNSSTGRPACFIAANSHCDRGPASSPIRVIARPRLPNHAISASGSLATFASRMILPSPSNTHTLDCSNDTSIPA